MIWEMRGTPIDPRVAALLNAGHALVQLIGPWTGPRPPLPQGVARISVLTPIGVHFGQGPMSVFSRDPKAVPVLGAAAMLVKALVDKSLGRDQRMD